MREDHAAYLGRWHEILKTDHRDAGQAHRIRSIVLHPNCSLTKSSITSDIALVELAEPVRYVDPAQLYTASDEDGLVATFVGIGDFGTGLTGPVSWGGINRAATNRVEKTDGDTIQFRFDAPGDPHAADLEGISGPGDSGGPAYVNLKGVLYTIGVSSWQDVTSKKLAKGRYGVIENYTRVSRYAKWIRDVTGLLPPSGG